MVGYISLWVVGVFILGFFAFAIPGVTDVPVSFTAVVLCVAAIVVAVAVYRARPRS